MNCRHCSKYLKNTFLDLGFQPPSNAYLSKPELKAPETYFPLKICVCDSCWLVQTEDYSSSDTFFTEDYAYFSSVSSSWLDHAKNYCHMIIDQLNLSEDSLVVEVASNDGYLLKNFVSAGIPCLGIEPTDSTAKVAEDLGINVMRDFFGLDFAKNNFKNKKADLILGNNVYAHVPDINDFTDGLKEALKIGGTITLEFPHLLKLIQMNQFDTVYHEHYSYLSLQVVKRIFEKAGLRVFNVEELSTHGGSLRVYGCHIDDLREDSPKVAQLLDFEFQAGLLNMATYLNYQPKAEKVKNDLLSFLIEQKSKQKKVLAYGAAAKGNTLLNFAGVKSDLLEFVYDAATSKQDKYLPGSHIPILNPSILYDYEVDFILILPWNLADEISLQLDHLRKRGTKFVTAVPSLRIF